MDKLSIIIPIYFNEQNLHPLYEDIKAKVLDIATFDVEIVMVDDGSKDESYAIIKELAARDPRIKAAKLSRNFGSHSAILCGLNLCTGDCAVVKAADLQEPSELLLKMYAEWKRGAKVVLAVRESREEKKSQTAFSNFYYWMTRKLALKQMPPTGFDIFLIDRAVITVLQLMDEKNTAITGQILWSGFQTTTVGYVRKAREIGKSRWTLAKKWRLVKDTLFSFSTVPISLAWGIGLIFCLFAIIMASVALIGKITNNIPIEGYTTLLIVLLLGFGLTMLVLGILGEYLYRAFDATRKRPVYIIDEQSNSPPE